MNTDEYQFHPLVTDRWPDFEKLFGPRGACGGCWCMYWKRTRKEYTAQLGEQNRLVQNNYVNSGKIPGLLAYHFDEPVGWCAVEPRIEYPGLDRSRILKPVDDTPVWSLTCFFVSKNYRRKGLSVALIRAAVQYVASLGGKVLEGYPVEPKKGNMPPVFAYTGLASAFEKAGFVEVARRSETRPIYRYIIDRQSGKQYPNT